MKISISFSLNTRLQKPCVAQAVVPVIGMVAGYGLDFDFARADLLANIEKLQKARSMSGTEIPESEEVEV
jgi:hypothetical protein